MIVLQLAVRICPLAFGLLYVNNRSLLFPATATDQLRTNVPEQGILMNLTGWPMPGCTMSAELSPLDGEMVELALLLPSWQAEALESSAHRHGQTAGQVLRALIGDYCRRLNQGPCYSYPDACDS